MLLDSKAVSKKDMSEGASVRVDVKMETKKYEQTGTEG